jgi:hypothetical protein
MTAEVDVSKTDGLALANVPRAITAQPVTLPTDDAANQMVQHVIAANLGQAGSAKTHGKL